MERLKGLVVTAVMAALLTNSIKAQENMNSVLSDKQQSMIAISALEAKGNPDGLKQALMQGLDDGLAVSEIKEALSQLYAYTGFPRSLNALDLLRQTLAEREAQGIKDNQGKDADPLPASYDALKDGTKVQTELSGHAFDYTFAPAVDYYLKAHLFGDIFARNNLTHSQRELVTVSALSALDGVEPQLTAHVNGARNMGLSDAEIHAMPAVLAERVGELEAYRLKKAIAAAYGEPFSEGRPVDNQAFPKGEPNTGYARYFIGDSFLYPYKVDGLGMSNVTFEPRCRNNWHIHHKTGQILVCVGGYGWYQEWGKPAQLLKPGDVVNIPAEVKHWHGATKDSWFQHLSIMVPVEGATSEWLEPVGDEEYDKLIPSRQYQASAECRSR